MAVACRAPWDLLQAPDPACSAHLPPHLPQGPLPYPTPNARLLHKTHCLHRPLDPAAIQPPVSPLWPPSTWGQMSLLCPPTACHAPSLRSLRGSRGLLGKAPGPPGLRSASCPPAPLELRSSHPTPAPPHGPFAWLAALSSPGNPHTHTPRCSCSPDRPTLASGLSSLRQPPSWTRWSQVHCQVPQSPLVLSV